jgi:cold shock CspA family protein
LTFKSQREAVVKYYGKIHTAVKPRGFGFIRRADAGPDIFFHFNDTPNRKGIAVGTQVEFDIRKDSKGRDAAIDVMALPWQEESPASVPAGVSHVD